jgi:hypothetical protein
VRRWERDVLRAEGGRRAAQHLHPRGVPTE